MTTHFHNANSSFAGRTQRSTLCNTRGAVTSRGLAKLFQVTKNTNEVTCEKCKAVLAKETK